MKYGRAVTARESSETALGLGTEAEFMLAKAREARMARPPMPPPFDVFEPLLALSLRRRWPDLCEDMFDFLAEKHPEQLALLLGSASVRPSDLTFAAEAAGRVADFALIRSAVLRLLGHESALVREGALRGLDGRLDAEIAGIVRDMAASDSSPGVRAVAGELLA